ncbi:MAG: HD domain-containing protein [Eubacteriaceae bacterium]|jgi:putative hydrolase of HD superfamily|nr:HD domain-containing protein [Eubacteriaceae bacterium]
MESKLKMQLDFLAEVDKMKSVYRQTLLIDKSRQENDAEHSWHFAFMAMVLFEYCGIEGVDINRVIRMALVHDLVEIYAGDTFAYDTTGYESKEAREKESADRLFAMLPFEQAHEYRSLWEEFDEAKTPDAIYASAVDRLQPFLNNARTQGHSWAKHKVSASEIYKRMDIVQSALPDLWEFVEQAITDNIGTGAIQPD